MSGSTFLTVVTSLVSSVASSAACGLSSINLRVISASLRLAEASLLGSAAMIAIMMAIDVIATT